MAMPSTRVRTIAQQHARLRAPFFNQATVSLAKALLGKQLVTTYRGVVTGGMIVEVEAYLGSNDPACHASRGKTPRNAVMFKSPGYCYVYLIYGMYHCVNVVSDPEGVGSAVLIRALEPTVGVQAMQRRRSQRVLQKEDLARGPGRLCEALAIQKSLSGEHFERSHRIWIAPGIDVAEEEVAASGRIGISQGIEMPLRFYIAGSPWVSGSRGHRRG